MLLRIVGLLIALNGVFNAQAQTIADDKTFENPSDRSDWFVFQRTYPFDTIKPELRSRAYLNLRRSRAFLGAFPFANRVTRVWQSIGPRAIRPFFDSMGATAGRVNSIAVAPDDPNLILVGSATGGIWRSVNGGTTFTPVADDQVDLAVGAIAFSPSHPRIAYAGMGDAVGGYMGSGILRSTDRGATWQRVSDASLPSPGTISSIAIDPRDPMRVYVCQYTYRVTQAGGASVYASGVFKSVDGGVTWRKVMKGVPTDIVVHPARAATLFAAMDTTFASAPPSAGVYRSDDYGETWRAVLALPYLYAESVKLAVSPAAPESVFAYVGGVVGDRFRSELFRSSDGGASWSSLSVAAIDDGQFSYNNYIAVDPRNSNIIYVGSRDVFKSSDAGRTWINLTNNWRVANGEWRFSPEAAGSHSDQHAIFISRTDPDRIYIGNDGGISRSVDGGAHFQSLNSTLTLSQFNSVTVTEGQAPLVCGGTQDNGAVILDQAPEVWREFMSGDSGQCLVEPGASDIVYTSYIYGYLYRFQSMRRLPIANNNTFGEGAGDRPRIAFYPPFVNNARTGELYFGTWRLFRSSDRGQTWRPTTGAAAADLTKGEKDVITRIVASPDDPAVIYTGSKMGRVMLTRDGGQTWTDVTAGLPNRFVTSLRVLSGSPGSAFVTFSGYGSGHIFRTVDFGRTWTDLSRDLQDVPVNDVVTDPVDRNLIYIATDIGVYFTNLTATGWSYLKEGMPPVIVTGLTTRSDGRIYAATYGRGVFELITRAAPRSAKPKTRRPN